MKLLLSITMTLALLLITTLAMAQDAVPDASLLVNTLLSAIELRAWGVVVGSVMLLLVVLSRYLQTVADIWRKVPPKWRPLIPAIIGILASVGNALSHRAQWLPILITDLLVNALPVLLAIVSPVAHLTPTSDVIPPAPRMPTITERG